MLSKALFQKGKTAVIMAKNVRMHCTTILCAKTQEIWHSFVTYLLNICILQFVLHQKILLNAMQEGI